MEEFGRSGFLSTEQVDRPITFYNIQELFQLAEEEGKRYIDENNKYERIDEFTAAKYQNIIGVVGAAGIGKTTLAKTMLDLALNLTQNEREYVFYLPLRSIDFGRKMNVLEFLMKYTLPSWKHSNDKDMEYLDEILNAHLTYIIIDGLDEVDLNKLRKRSSDVSLFDYTFPDQILKNLLSGHLLPNAEKLITSRPAAFHEIDPLYKPLFVVKLLGLGESSQLLLIEQLCSKSEYSKVKNHFETHPGLSRFCFNPMHCIMLIRYIQKTHHHQNIASSVSEVFAATFDDCIRSVHFKHKPENLSLLTELALRGVKENRFIFTYADVTEGWEVVEVFLKLKIITKKDFHVKILDGDKRFFFAHLQWQEFFASVHLMFVESLEGFQQLLPQLSEPRWHSVTQFLFGFYRSKVEDVMSVMFSTYSKTDFEAKKLLLLNTIPSKLPLGTLKKQDKFFTVCAWAFEAYNVNVTQQVYRSFPQSLHLMQHITPSDIAALSFILFRVEKPIAINLDYGMFHGQALSQFLHITRQTSHQVSV